MSDTTAPTRSWLPAFFGIALMWGTSFLFIKVAVAELHPAWLAFGRIALGALTLGAMLAVLRQRLPGDRRLWLHLFVLGFVANTVPFTLFAYAEQRVSSIVAGIWNGTAPLTTLAVTLVAMPSERPTHSRVAGLLLGFVGVLVVLGAWRSGGASLSGQLMLLGAVSCYGVAFNHIRWITRRWDTSGVTLSFGQLGMSALQLAVIAPLVAGSPPAPGSLSAGVVWSMVALGILGSGLAFVLQYRVVRLAGMTTASTVTYVVPVFAAIAGVVVLGEHLAWNQPVGGLIVLAGVAVSQGLVVSRLDDWRSRRAARLSARC